MKNTTTLNKSLTVAAFLFTTAPFTSLYPTLSASAANSPCLKAYGTTPTEAFHAATKLLKDADTAMEPGSIEDTIQIRLLSKKEKGQFVALAYSLVHYAEGCDIEVKEASKITDEQRPKCDQIQCTI